MVLQHKAWPYLTKRLPTSTLHGINNEHSKDFLLVHFMVATMNISNQKNRKQAQTIHQKVIHTQCFPTRALIQRLKHTLDHTNDKEAIIGTYFTQSHPGDKWITAPMMNTAVKEVVVALYLDKQGLLKKYVCSHSLKVGEAMAMQLNVIDHNTIIDGTLVNQHFPDVHPWINCGFLHWCFETDVKPLCIPEYYFPANKWTHSPLTRSLLC